MSALKIDEPVKTAPVQSAKKSRKKGQAHRPATQDAGEVIVVKRSKEVSDYVGSPLSALKRSPVAFAVTAVLGLGLGFAAGSLTSSGPAEQAEAVQTASSAADYASLSSRDLRLNAFRLTSQMRNLLVEWAAETTPTDLIGKMQNASSPSQQQEAWSEYVAASAFSSGKWMTEYQQKLMPQAVAVRDELLSRLEEPERPPYLDDLYETAANPVDVRQVLEDLTWLAESLQSP